MATLIKNAWIDGKGYGPGFGNADEVPASVAAKIDADAWDEAPEVKPKRSRKAEPKPAPAPEAPSYAEAAAADAAAIAALLDED